MKYLIFSDVHGNMPAFKQFLRDTADQKYDQIVFLGDFIGYYYDPEEIITHCRVNNFTCILGNHDDYFLKMLAGEIEETYLVGRYGHSYRRAKETISNKNVDFLKSLDKQAVLVDEKSSKVFLCHGSPADLLNGRVYPDTDLAQFEDLVSAYDYVVLGNTHHKMSRKHNDTSYINPGSLGQQRDGKGCSYLIMDTETGFEFKTVHYDIESLEALVDKYDNGREGLKAVLRRAAADEKQVH